MNKLTNPDSNFDNMKDENVAEMIPPAVIPKIITLHSKLLPTSVANPASCKYLNFFLLRNDPPITLIRSRKSMTKISVLIVSSYRKLGKVQLPPLHFHYCLHSEISNSFSILKSLNFPL